MTLQILNTNGTAPYGIGEIMHAEPVRDLNHAENRFGAWCEANLPEGGTQPRGVVVDGDDRYNAATGELAD